MRLGFLAMSRTLWVHGPISRDTMIYLERLPKSGEFLRAQSVSTRVGGTAANIAFGLATTDIPIGFLTWLGNDDIADELRQALDQSNLTHVTIMEKDAPSEHVHVYVENDGERTILGINPSFLRELHIEDAPIKSGDVFLFTLWWPEYLPDLLELKARGCTVILGARALDDVQVQGADLIIGSVKDYSGQDIKGLLQRFPRIVLTNGIEGSTEYHQSQTYHQSAFEAAAVDATGAGDAFIAGYLTGFMKDFNPQECLKLGSQWAAMAVETYSSIPPDFSAVKSRWGLK